MLIFLIRIILFLISMFDSDSRFNKVVKVNGSLLFRRVRFILFIDIGIKS